MKLAWLKRKMQVHHICGGLLALVMCLFLALVNSAQLDHTTIAFTSDRDSDWMAAERNVMSEIYLMDPNGDQIRRLTEAPGYDEAPAWAPDGQTITFVSHRDQVLQIPNDKFFRGEIYVTNVDGSDPINLTQSLKKCLPRLVAGRCRLPLHRLKYSISLFSSMDALIGVTWIFG